MALQTGTKDGVGAFPELRKLATRGGVKSRSRVGRNVHMSVLNICESLNIITPSHVSDMVPNVVARCVDVISPSIALPATNSGTVRSRWKSWSMFTAGFSLKRIDPDQVCQEALGAIGNKTLVCVKDAASTNKCLVAMEERALADQRSRGEGNVAALLSIDCFAHACVLAMKPSFNMIDGATGFVVRVGHLCESSRVFGSMVDAATRVVRKSFRMRRLMALSPDVLEAQSRSRRTLQTSAPSGDMAQAMVDVALAVDNGDWDE